MARVLLIGTYETKALELGYFAHVLREHGLAVEEIDVSLDAGGTVLAGAEKLARMAARAEAASAEIARQCDTCIAAVGVGGGTGGEIVLAALKGLPSTYPKILVTTLAFDPRAALADAAITLVPTLCDIEGLNSQLRQVFENTAASVAGLAAARPVAREGKPKIAVTTLGATGPAGTQVARGLGAAGLEATVFHANGYGGAAFTRFVEEGHADGVIDLNVHELGRMLLAGAHVPMPTRFTCAHALPRVVLPGALNFLGLDGVETVAPDHLARPHYRHTRAFTHVKLTAEEMESHCLALAHALNGSTAPCHVILPMGGFSHEDRPGGAIEDKGLRELAAEVLEAQAEAFSVTRLPDHINSPPVAEAAVTALRAHITHETPA